MTRLQSNSARRKDFTAATHECRCKFDIRLRGDGPNEGAQCMRKAVVDGFCRQHAFTFKRTGSGVGIDGWFKIHVRRSDGKDMEVTKTRFAQLVRAGRVVDTRP